METYSHSSTVTYNPPSVPRRPRTPSPLSWLHYHLRLAYFRYSVDLGLYVMGPTEKLIFNSVVLTIVSLISYYLLPLAVPTLVCAVFRLFTMQSPNPTQLKVQNFLGDTDMVVAAATYPEQAPTIDTMSMRSLSRS